jgi:hypothetical protein
MSRLLFKFTLVITFAFALIDLVALMLGSTQPPNPVLRGFTENCEHQPQPCWYGIVPGVTTMADVKDRLLSSGYAVDSVSAMQLNATKTIDGECQNASIMFDAHVKQINIDLCDTVLLGDFVKQFNQPQYIILDPSSVWYQGEIQMIFGKYGLSWDKVSYHTPLQELILFPDKSTIPQLRQPWLDLLVQRKYCDFKGLRYHCSS